VNTKNKHIYPLLAMSYTKLTRKTTNKILLSLQQSITTKIHAVHGGMGKHNRLNI